MKRFAICTIVSLIAASAALAAKPQLGEHAKTVVAERNETRDARMQWWREARYGMFVHWGGYAAFGGYYKGKKSEFRYAEHIQNGYQYMTHRNTVNTRIPIKEYQAVVATFNPVRFDAQQWVRIAKNAGMKYMVFTAKHHEGFCMFDSQYTDYSIVRYTPFKRDVTMELKKACDDAGIKFCLYYSHMDWSSEHGERRDYFHRRPGYPEYRLLQVKEIMEKYQPAGLWFDDYGCRGTPELVRFIRRSWPNTILNERVVGRGAGYGDYSCTEQSTAVGTGYDDWESCMTMNDSWGYHKGDNDWKTAEQLALSLIRSAAYGGNFLLNVGPDGLGEIPPACVTRLEEIGAWLKVNGDAIYGTTATPYEDKRPAYLCTQKSGKLYAFMTNHWPKEGIMLLPRMKNKVRKAYFLSDAARSVLPTETVADGVTIALPAEPPKSLIPVMVLEIDGPVELAAAADEEVQR